MNFKVWGGLIRTRARRSQQALEATPSVDRVDSEAGSGVFTATLPADGGGVAGLWAEAWAEAARCAPGLGLLAAELCLE